MWQSSIHVPSDKGNRDQGLASAASTCAFGVEGLVWGLGLRAWGLIRGPSPKPSDPRS